MEKVVLAYSGGLDTSFCIPYLKSLNYEVVTITADTGGFSEEELATLEEKSRKLGSTKHKTINCRKDVFDRFAAYIIKGNILRGGIYPLCVGAERVIQAEELVKFAKEVGATAVAHGCTGAGNDQVRFDVAIKCIDPKLKIIAPIRELALQREEEVEFLKKHGFSFPSEKKKYSINQGILGTTIGGGETHDSWLSIPDEAYVQTNSLSKTPDAPTEIEISFKNGVPSAINDLGCSGYEALIKLNDIGAEYGIGRGIHLGDTVLGIKGRIAFEAPGATILIQAHRELEKLVLTKWQMALKDTVSQQYGMLLHEGQWQNPVMRDIEAFIDSSQRNMTGDVRVKLHKSNISIEGVRSPNSLMGRGALYGEGSKLWSGKDAEGFCNIVGMQTILASQPV